ncbi:uncharacterized protein OCT59_004725 [Rhizophagus irregularis]|uniref:uncharacterized protein n=1 Tax=Rhizophagus irregularis TaxID=588596 RepID=UPI003324B1BB|nr:hypothetical protein OCT59_004725 [Rhizophagus irregularis]
MEEFMLSSDVLEQIKDFNYRDLTDEQSLLIDRLILNEESKERYRRNGLCKECKQPNTGNTGDTWCRPCGFSTIYKAFWKDGYIRCWDSENNKWYRSKIYVALKCLNDSKDITAEFLNEIGSHIMTGSLYVNRCYGITKDPKSGLCRPANVSPSKDQEIYGVLPYVAPEVIKRKKYTQESDIYSFGIIAYEVCTGNYPYHDMTRDTNLAISICGGHRPESNYKIPQLILNIIKQCWDTDPLKRPKAKEINDLLEDYYGSYGVGEYEINKQIEEADRNNENLPPPLLNPGTNPQASKLLDFKNLLEQKNAIDSEDDDKSFDCSDFVEPIDFTKL